MKLESITCNHCGAPLQVPEGTNYVTCTHCNRQLAVVREGGARFTKVIEDLHEQVSKLTQQNDVEALDREWEQRKIHYVVTDKHGNTHVPTKTGSVVGGLFVVAFGLVWTVFAGGLSLFATAGTGGVGAITLCFPLFGLCFIGFGAYQAYSAYHKAGEYEQAYEEYQRRRRELIENSSAERPA